MRRAVNAVSMLLLHVKFPENSKPVVFGEISRKLGPLVQLRTGQFGPDQLTAEEASRLGAVR